MSNNSWSSQARSGGGFFGTDKTCPPVEDCNVKNFLGTRRAPKAKAETETESGNWPFAGKYRSPGNTGQNSSSAHGGPMHGNGASLSNGNSFAGGTSRECRINQRILSPVERRPEA